MKRRMEWWTTEDGKRVRVAVYSYRSAAGASGSAASDVALEGGVRAKQ